MTYVIIFYDTDCPEGYAYVRDYMGNLCYYGSVEACKEFIKHMEGEMTNEDI